MLELGLLGASSALYLLTARIVVAAFGQAALSHRTTLRAIPSLRLALTGADLLGLLTYLLPSFQAPPHPPPPPPTSAPLRNWQLPHLLRFITISSVAFWSRG